MNPGWPCAVVYWPTITPESLMPKADAAVPPVGMKVVRLPPLSAKALPFPSVPTTVPAEFTPKAMAVVELLMFSGLAVVETRGFVVKLWRLPSLAIVNPTAEPELAIPFMLVPAPAVVPGFGPSKLTNW
jgi:hypothetical protein